MVVKRGLNDGSVLDMAGHFRGTGHVLRLIEYMDVGTTNGWQMDDVVPASELIEAIDARVAGRARRRPPIRARSRAATATATGPARSA